MCCGEKKALCAKSASPCFEGSTRLLKSNWELGVVGDGVRFIFEESDESLRTSSGVGGEEFGEDA